MNVFWKDKNIGLFLLMSLPEKNYFITITFTSLQISQLHVTDSGTNLDTYLEGRFRLHQCYWLTNWPIDNWRATRNNVTKHRKWASIMGKCGKMDGKVGVTSFFTFFDIILTRWITAALSAVPHFIIVCIFKLSHLNSQHPLTAGHLHKHNIYKTIW